MPQNPNRRAYARELVKEVVKDNGFVRESSLKTMTQEVRREVEEALLVKDRKIGASVLTYVFKSANRVAAAYPILTYPVWQRISMQARLDSSLNFSRMPMTTNTL